MTDTSLIRKKLSELENNIQTLERLRSYSLTDLQNDKEKAWSVEHGLQLSIQIIIDTGNHILAAKGEQEVEEYVDIIDKLGERAIVPSEFAQAIRGMAGFRNILIHEYASVDMKKVYDVLHNRLDDFRKFAGYIDMYLSRLQA